jgi:hypothetical protein
MTTKSITITAPASGTKCFLVLKAQKNGVTVFQEQDEVFTLSCRRSISADVSGQGGPLHTTHRSSMPSGGAARA